MPEAGTGTTAEALRGPYAGLDLDALVDWPVVRVWLYWGMFWLMIAPTVGAAIAGLFNYPDYLGSNLALSFGRLRPVHVNGVIMGAFSRGHDALIAFAPAETPVLWPEHFDVAIRVQEANFGVSPGDGFIEEPYAYVGVSRPAAGDPFWNVPFGAAVRLAELPGSAAVTAFFAEGRNRIK